MLECVILNFNKKDNIELYDKIVKKIRMLPTQFICKRNHQNEVRWFIIKKHEKN